MQKMFLSNHVSLLQTNKKTSKRTTEGTSAKTVPIITMNPTALTKAVRNNKEKMSR